MRCGTLAALAAAAAAWSPPKEAGPYHVAHDVVTLPDPKAKAEVVYPVAALGSGANATGEMFPFIAFAHGGAVPAGMVWTDYAGDMEVIASYGFVVVATQLNEMGVPPTWGEQQRAVIKTCKADPSLHESFASADFGRVGVVGHSMGGIATRESAASDERASLNIIAGWMQHPCSERNSPGHTNDDGKIRIPMLITSGTEDVACGTGGDVPVARASFKNQVNAKPRILFIIEGAGHLDPMFSCSGSTCRELIPGGLFLTCHIRGDQTACAKIYGPSGKNVCSLNTQIPWPAPYTFNQCEVVPAGGPAPPTPPGPKPPAPPTPPTPPTPPAPQPSAACVAELEKDCAGDKGKDQACSLCVLQNQNALRSAGCNIVLGSHDDAWVWCHQQ